MQSFLVSFLFHSISLVSLISFISHVFANAFINRCLRSAQAFYLPLRIRNALFTLSSYVRIVKKKGESVSRYVLFQPLRLQLNQIYLHFRSTPSNNCCICCVYVVSGRITCLGSSTKQKIKNNTKRIKVLTQKKITEDEDERNYGKKMIKSSISACFMSERVKGH